MGKKVYIVNEFWIPDDGERISAIRGVFAARKDANRLVKDLYIDYLENDSIEYPKRASAETLRKLALKEKALPGLRKTHAVVITSHDLIPKSRKRT